MWVDHIAMASMTASAIFRMGMIEFDAAAAIQQVLDRLS
jgi:hypothetical protein